MHFNLTRRAIVLAAALAAVVSGPATAQDKYPSRPIKIVVGFAPGGGSDLIARIIANKMSAKLGQTVIVENKPGAGSNIGAELALKSPADGYTLFLAAASYTVNPAVYKLRFDPIADETPIAQLARGPMIIAVNPKVPAKTLQEFVALAKKEPGKLSYASAGNGSITHIVTEYFLDTAGTDVVHVPYKGTSPALTDTISGATQLVFGTVGSTLPFIKSGQLRALAVTTPARLPALPDAPTVAESGYATWSVTNWHGLIAPKGVPRDIQLKLNKAVMDSLHDPDVEQTLAKDGLTPAGGTPEDFQKLLTSEIARWGALAKKRNIKVD